MEAVLPIESGAESTSRSHGSIDYKMDGTDIPVCNMETSPLKVPSNAAPYVSPIPAFVTPTFEEDGIELDTPIDLGAISYTINQIYALTPPNNYKEINILMMGLVGAGKSALCNTLLTLARLLGLDPCNIIPSMTGTTSVTKVIKSYPLQSPDGSKRACINLIDIPGLGPDSQLDNNRLRGVLSGEYWIGVDPWTSTNNSKDHCKNVQANVVLLPINADTVLAPPAPAHDTLRRVYQETRRRSTLHIYVYM